MHHEERYHYTEFEENNLLLEDDAIVCSVKSKKKRYDTEENAQEGTSTSTESDCVYDDMLNIQHNVTRKSLNYLSEDSSSLDSMSDERFSQVHFLL